jgi:histidinol-phosphate aminotransferase
MVPIRPNVLRMHPYSPGKPISEVQRELGLETVIKLASNENPLGPSPKAVAAVKEAAESMHLYPDASVHDLREAISAKFDVAGDQIFVGNGSDELIHLIGLILLEGPEDEIVVGSPSFVRYDAAAHLAASRLIKVPLDSRGVHDLPAMARAVTERTKLVFIANPNNPTGTIVRRPELERFLDDLPDHVVTVLDEAYFEFAVEDAGYPNSLEYVKRGRNVIGLRTFSKTYGLAGIRVGYGFAPAVIVDAIERAREPFNVNSLAQVAAIAALQDEEHIRRTVDNNRRGVARVSKILSESGGHVCESFANFVYAEYGKETKPIFDALLRRGVIVRLLGSPTCLRISVGTDSEMDVLEREFKTVMTELHPEGAGV